MLIFYQNTNGICTKLDEFRRKAERWDYDVILVTETKLNDAHGLNFGNYKVYRRDRDIGNGGGVMIAVDKDRNYQKRKWDTSFTEDIWLSMKYRNYTVHICCVYIVPQCPVIDFEDFIDNVRKRMKDNPKDCFLIVGDFNMPDFTAKKTLGNEGGKLRQLQDLCDDFNLRQYNRGKNFNGRTLDLVLCNKKVSVRKISGLVRQDDHHPSFDIQL